MLISYGIQNVIERLMPLMTPLHPGAYYQIQLNFAHITCLISRINMLSNKCKENEITILSEVLKYIKRIWTLISIWLCFIIVSYFLIITICEIGLMSR